MFDQLGSLRSFLTTTLLSVITLSSLSIGIGISTVQSVDREQEFFTEITDKIGLSSGSRVWPNGTYAMHEIIGGGIAVFDYDCDGKLDLLQVRFPPPSQSGTTSPNLLFQQQADGTFLDVTEESQLGNSGYGQGVAIGDTDNDGDLDVYFADFGHDTFYRNNGDGTFIEATSVSGFADNAWSTSAAFVDYDRDNDLDLYITHYVEYDPTNVCRGDHGLQDYCNPQVFEGTQDSLYRNNGDGTFTNVTSPAGITTLARGLGVVCTDLTGDGWPDFYVANDGEANQLWVNQGNGEFVDEAIIRGVAFNSYGQPEGSMGVAVGDVNGDQKLDLFMTHLTGETNTLYIASEYEIFIDATDTSGFSGIDSPFTGFGCGFFDFDNDSNLDLAIVNGRVKRGPVFPKAKLGKFWNAYAEPNLLFQNDGNGNFTDVSLFASTFCSEIEVNRGLAFGDIDNDGDIDLVMDSLGGLPRVFRNNASSNNHWLLVRALTENRDAIGAQVTLILEEIRLVRLVLPGYSYISSNDPRVHFGLGKIDKIEAIEIIWPNGQQEHFSIVNVDTEITIHQGKGQPL